MISRKTFVKSGFRCYMIQGLPLLENLLKQVYIPFCFLTLIHFFLKHPILSLDFSFFILAWHCFALKDFGRVNLQKIEFSQWTM